jgi:hypothetical protein
MTGFGEAGALLAVAPGKSGVSSKKTSPGPVGFGQCDAAGSH